MATTIDTDHVVGSTVYHVSQTDGVREGIVKMIDIRVPITGEINMSVKYTVYFTNSVFGTIVADEEDLYSDVDAALAAYKPLI